jgi:glycosyltransferase involved in cell wall biosynthesis
MKPGLNPHILIISYNDYPAFDGLSTRIENLAKYYVSQGCQVTLFLPNVDYEQDAFESLQNTSRIVRVNIPFVGLFRKSRIALRSYVTVLQTFSTLYFFVKYLRKIKIDIIQAQQIYAIPPALLLKLLTRGRVVADDITTVSDILKDTGHKYLAGVFTLLERICFFFCDDFIYTSSVCREYCRARGVEPGIFGPNGVDCGKFSPLSVQNERKIIFFNCSTYYHQNLHAISWYHQVCLKLLDRVNVPFVFHLVCGPLENLPESFLSEIEMIKDVFQLEPSVQNIEDWIRNADITLLPYKEGDHLTGGVRLKTLEYMACGKIVISTGEGIEGIPGIADDIHVLIRETQEDFVQTLIAVLQQPKQYEHIASSARQFVEEHYNWNSIGREILKAYSKLLSS